MEVPASDPDEKVNTIIDFAVSSMRVSRMTSSISDSCWIIKQKLPRSIQDDDGDIRVFSPLLVLKAVRSSSRIRGGAK